MILSAKGYLYQSLDILHNFNIFNAIIHKFYCLIYTIPFSVVPTDFIKYPQTIYSSLSPMYVECCNDCCYQVQSSCAVEHFMRRLNLELSSSNSLPLDDYVILVGFLNPSERSCFFLCQRMWPLPGSNEKLSLWMLVANPGEPNSWLYSCEAAKA